MGVTHIQFGGEQVLTGADAYEADDIAWTLDDNNVGHVYESEEEDNKIKYQAIAHFEDGEYGLILSNYEEVSTTSSNGSVAWTRMEHVYYVSDRKVIIKDGQVDVDSVKEATAELLNKCGYHGVFIEALWEVDFDVGLLDRKQFIHLALGS